MYNANGNLSVALLLEYNNKTTQVWFLREKKHTSDGLWPGNPRDRRNYQTTTKTTKKLLLIPEFHMPRS
jgi:hypothetical protein